jgi:transposase
VVRSIGLDVHRDFCEVAILDGCGGRKRGRVASTPENLQLFAQSLAPDDPSSAVGGHMRAVFGV